MTVLPSKDKNGLAWNEDVLRSMNGNGCLWSHPDGSYETSNPIDIDTYYTWTPSVDALLAYAAAKRYDVETGGCVVNGAQVATDRESQASIGNAYLLLQVSGAPSINFKTATGFVTLTADQFKTLALGVGAHVQGAFNEEGQLDSGIRAVPPTVTTYTQIDAAPWPSNNS